MTTLKQIEANRRNALKSTGPRTQEGKRIASRNAVRHGLTAETVIDRLEDPEDYRAFEQAVAADYDPQTAVERELVLRLANLLWRLRRASSIETGLMSMEGEIEPRGALRSPPIRAPSPLLRVAHRAADAQASDSEDHIGNSQAGEVPMDTEGDDFDLPSLITVQGQAARRFLRVINLGNGPFDRLTRYEITLWRQVRQTLRMLEVMRWRFLSPGRRAAHSWSHPQRRPSRTSDGG